MLSYENLIMQLTDLGLNRYEATIYITLVSDGISSAKNISDMTGIPYGKVYEIFNNLAKKGFVTILPSKPLKAQAIAPEEMMANVKKNLYEKYEQVEKIVVKELSPQYAQSKKFTEPHALFWMIRGRSNINFKVDTLLRKAKKSIHINVSANGLKRAVIFKDLLLDAKRKGVEILISSVLTNDNLEDVDSLDFCEIRHVESSHNHFYSVDNKKCIIVESLPDDDNIINGRDVGMLVESESFTQFIETFFASHFDQALPLEKAIPLVRRSSSPASG